MQLNLLNERIARFKQHLGGKTGSDLLHLYDSQAAFAASWDVEADDLATCYDQSLQNTTTRRLWKREAYEPKAMMLAFIRMESDYIRFIFRDLFNESIDSAIRATRFVFYCDELLEQYKKAHPRSIDNNHYHSDYHMICLYLAFRYPDQYTLYHQPAFAAFLRQLNARNVSDGHDMERFFKVMRTVQKLLLRDEALVRQHLQRFVGSDTDQTHNLLLAYEFYRFCTKDQVLPPF
jgi:hypothetical protein